MQKITKTNAREFCGFFLASCPSPLSTICARLMQYLRTVEHSFLHFAMAVRDGRGFLKFLIINGSKKISAAHRIGAKHDIDFVA